MIVGVVACVVLTAVIGYWIFTAGYESQHDVRHEAHVRMLREKKQAVYENLKDLHFEYTAGKLSDEDYRQSRAMLENEAAQVVAALEREK